MIQFSFFAGLNGHKNFSFNFSSSRSLSPLHFGFIIFSACMRNSAFDGRYTTYARLMLVIVCVEWMAMVLVPIYSICSQSIRSYTDSEMVGRGLCWFRIAIREMPPQHIACRPKMKGNVLFSPPRRIQSRIESSKLGRNVCESCAYASYMYVIVLAESNHIHFCPYIQHYLSWFDCFRAPNNE